MKYDYTEISKMIDHSLLNPTLTPRDLENGCRLALAYDVASVCIMPFAVSGAAALLSGSNVHIGSTIGFPHGCNATTTKIFEAKQAINDGAVELDMVLNISLALAGRFEEVEQEIATLATVAHEGRASLKIVFENSLLSDELKIVLCGCCSNAGVDWIATSTGYGGSSALDEDIQLMRENSASEVGIKANGDVGSLDRLLEVRELGCGRAGVIFTSKILESARRELGIEPISKAGRDAARKSARR